MEAKVKNLRETVSEFGTVTLADLNKVKLMNRMDQKFCLPADQLMPVLRELSNEYSMLEIDGEKIFRYSNIYFDTIDDKMFLSHQNGRRNRYKVRMRRYVETNDCFLEIKFKNNKGRTIKSRVERTDMHPAFADRELLFLQQLLPFQNTEIIPKLQNRFFRMTLVDQQYTERITIDLFPEFENKSDKMVLDNLVIIEVKYDRSSQRSLMSQILRTYRIRERGFSKYCIGRSLLDTGIKKNNFKPILLEIKKKYIN